MKHSSTSVGLTLSLLGTLLTIPLNKKYHVMFGIIMTMYTGVHSWQYRNRLKKHFTEEVHEMSGLFAGVTDFFHEKKIMSFLSQHVQVSHYIPGRVRLYSRELLNNFENVQKVQEYLTSVAEIHSFSINPATGSILIQYSPEDVAKQPLLKEVEKLVAKQYRRGSV